MKYEEMFIENEKPLDRMVSDGGFTGIFRKIACIGDSLSSGEFQSIGELGQNLYFDMFDYSWGQYLARMAGCEVYNFSRGGMTAKEYLETYADSKNFWERGLDAQAFIMALGVNDLSQVLRGLYEFGSVEDITPDNTFGSRHTFVGSYASIIQRIISQQPHVHFFLMTIPRSEGKSEEQEKLEERHREVLYELAKIFPRVHVLDLRQYAPVYDAEFRKHFFLGGHMNPAGYLFTAKMVASYMDYIIRHEMDQFMQTGFIGTDIRHPEYFK